MITVRGFISAILFGLVAFLLPNSPANLFPAILYAQPQLTTNEWNVWNMILQVLIIFRKILAGILAYSALRILNSTVMFVFIIHILICVYSLISALKFTRQMIFNRKDLFCVAKVQKMFREVQLLFKLYNEMHKSTVFIALILYTNLAFATCGYILVTKHSELNIVYGLILINIWYLQVMLILTCLNLPKQTYVVSKVITNGTGLSESLRKVKVILGRNEVKSKKQLECFWKSCPPLKILISSGNFFERATPLVLLNFSINLMVNLILLQE